ncbi:MAG: hypothetical protein AAF126_11980 [Chloroflexota bacterium]
MRKIVMIAVWCLLMGFGVLAQDDDTDDLVYFNDGDFPLEWNYPAGWGEPAVYPDPVYEIPIESLDSYIIDLIQSPVPVNFAPAEAYFYQNELGQLAVLMMIDGDTFWATENADPVPVTVDDFYGDIETFNGYTRLYVDEDVADSLGLREIVFGNEITYSLTRLGALPYNETIPALIFEVGVWEYDFATHTLTDFDGAIYTRQSNGWLGTFATESHTMFNEFTVLALPFIVCKRGLKPPPSGGDFQ